MDSCIFCRIVKGELPASRVWEDDKYLAFLTIKPINPGHTLVITKKHADYFFDLDDETLGTLMVKTKPIAQAIAKAFKPKTGRVGIMVAGMGVPHVHVHLIPMNGERDLDFNKAQEASLDQVNTNAEKIKAEMDKSND